MRFAKLIKKIFKSVKKKITTKTFVLGENSVIYPGARVQNLHSEVDRIKIGANSHIAGRVLTYPSGGKITIGDYCYVGENTNIWSACSIEIGNDVLISHNVDVFDHDTHPIDPLERHKHAEDIFGPGHPKVAPNWNEKPVKIHDNAWIGCKAIILKGVTIGKAAIVGAGSVVVKNVEPYTIVAGNPAKEVRKIEHKCAQ